MLLYLPLWAVTTVSVLSNLFFSSFSRKTFSNLPKLYCISALLAVKLFLFYPSRAVFQLFRSYTTVSVLPKLYFSSFGRNKLFPFYPSSISALLTVTTVPFYPSCMSVLLAVTTISVLPKLYFSSFGSNNCFRFTQAVVQLFLPLQLFSFYPCCISALLAVNCSCFSFYPSCI